jgi:pilus assembly protein CpaE
VTILCEPDLELAAELAPALDLPVRSVGTLDEAVAAVRADPNEHLLVVGPEAPLEDVLATATALRSERPGLAIVLLRTQIARRDVRRVAAAGVRQVVGTADSHALATVCRQLREETSLLVAERPVPGLAAGTEHLQQSPTPQGRVVTVFSPKGGSGKTTVSTNLAVALNDSSERRVCLVDLDLEFGDVAISLRLEPMKSLVDAVTTDAPDDADAAVNMLVTPFRPGLDCILAPIEPGAATKISASLVADLLQLLRSRYDYIVVDTPSQLSETVLAAVDAADELILLANPEIPALKNLRLTIDTLDLIDQRRDARLIVFNKADDALGLTAAEVEQALGVSIAARVPASRDVPASINKGVPIVAAQPNHPVSIAIRDFAAQFIVKAPAAASGRRRGLFRRRS